MNALFVFALLFLLLGVLGMVWSVVRCKGTDSLMVWIVGEALFIVGLIQMAGYAVLRALR